MFACPELAEWVGVRRLLTVSLLTVLPIRRVSRASVWLGSFLLRLRDDNSRELDDWWRSIFAVPVVTEGRFECQLAIRDFGESDIGMTEPRRKFNERAMTDAKLSNAS